MRRMIVCGATLLLAIAPAGAADFSGAQGAGRAVDVCVGTEAPDLFCRHYGYSRGTLQYARCWGIIAGYGPGPALSNGYTINTDPNKTLPPRQCRPPRYVAAR